MVSHSKELWGEKDRLFFSKRELHHYNRKPNAIVYTCIYFLGERGHSTLNHIEVVHYTFIHDLNNVASKTKHESKIVCYLKSEIKHPPCSAGPDFDYSSRVSTQRWHLHSCKALWFFPLKFFQHKKNMFSNWESEDGSVFIDLTASFLLPNVKLLVFCHVLTSLSKVTSKWHFPHPQGSTLRHWFSTCWNLSPVVWMSPIPLGKTGVSFSKGASGMNF